MIHLIKGMRIVSMDVRRENSLPNSESNQPVMKIFITRFFKDPFVSFLA